MRISRRFPFIGLQLLLLIHIAHSFVLLTANLEDVKKLARKLVSASLAEKIADFIAKATQHIGPNVSEEKEEVNAEDEQVSEENNVYNIERLDFESGGQENVKSKEESIVENRKKKIVEKEDEASNVDSKSTSIEQINKAEEYNIGQPKEPNVKNYPLGFEEPSRYVKVKPNAVPQYAYPLKIEDKKPSGRMSYEEEENYNKEKQNKYLDENSISTTEANNAQYENQYLKEKKARKKIKGRPYRLLSHLNSLEDNEVTDAPDNSYNNTSDDFSENELYINQKRPMGMTTKKAAYEFDEYDNKNYHKALTMPQVTDDDKTITDKWWEKELPDEEDAKRKSWF